MEVTYMGMLVTSVEVVRTSTEGCLEVTYVGMLAIWK